MNHPNHDLIRRAYEAFCRGDIPTVLGILDKRIRWHIPGQSPLSNMYISHEQVLGFSKRAWSYPKGPYASMYTRSLRATRRYLFSAPSARPDPASTQNSSKCIFGELLTMAQWSFASFKVTNKLITIFGLKPKHPPGPPMTLGRRREETETSEIKHH